MISGKQKSLAAIRKLIQILKNRMLMPEKRTSYLPL